MNTKKQKPELEPIFMGKMTWLQDHRFCDVCVIYRMITINRMRKGQIPLKGKFSLEI